MKKNLTALLPLLLSALAVFAQQDEEKPNIIKIQPQPFEDSIVYKRENAVLYIDRHALDDYFKMLDTALQQRKYSPKVYQNVQFAHLTEQDVQNHYSQAIAFWTTVPGQPLVYDVNNFNYFWTNGPGILQPYIDEILPQLLQQGKVHLVEKNVKAPVTKYLFANHDINGRNYRIYKFADGKEILREQDIYTEPIINTSKK
ncbi:hypothetical protein GA0116948_10595 [Chitinophaga costaii]|uniref:Uncharacterized protein n=1 Tax=Chitinophaga costaii TaxID=1335309 RepID=A0A1C4D6G5_9BACT|nr:hypothetical protein [Chitinophaga costaii]PUZ24477.1 hypothetical protein DCM91_11250 [Chitinophaga costaii]SCC26927.1 hypothetical protein GA0116948_10595 [Chitinophaga costaii]